jgi:hypothetical protein
MTIKDRILRVLDEKGLKYSDLINELNTNDDSMNEIDILDESQLDKLIESLSIPLLERVSKILGIPLYSFYYDPNNKVIINPNENKFYNKDIWKDDIKNPLD